MDLIKIGYICSPHGLKGEVKIGFSTDQIDLYFKLGNTVYLTPNPEEPYKPYEITSLRFIPNNQALLIVKGISDIDQAQLFRRGDIKAEKIEVEGRIYLKDILGYAIVGQSGKEYGTADDFQMAGTRSYIICGGKFLPYIANTIVVSIDKDKKQIIISPIGEDMLTNA